MNYLLITTTQCTKCPGFKKELEDMGFFKDYQGEIIDETDDDFEDIVDSFQIQSAPVLLMFEHEYTNKRDSISEFTCYKFTEIYDLQKFLKDNPNK